MHDGKCKGPTLTGGPDETFPTGTPFDRRLADALEARFGKNTSPSSNLDTIPDKKSLPPGMS